jgi:hypothetical protein
MAFESERAIKAEARYNARNERLNEQAALRKRELDAQIETIERTPAGNKDALRRLLNRVDNSDRENSE